VALLSYQQETSFSIYPLSVSLAPLALLYIWV
jgi:hypothetical protein